MRIGCLQFAPVLGDVDNNLDRADAVLDHANPEDLDLLVLPELAFSGYNFKSLAEIAQYLEPSVSGITSLWARSQALKHDCTVIAGYPEKVDVADRWPTNPEYYNSAVVINSEGEDVGNYRKSHLYYTDESWALEGPGYFAQPLDNLGMTALGICMDINPYKFEAPWDKFEFATHALKTGAKLVVVSMAWITHDEQTSFIRTPDDPDMDTLSYWISRLEPIIRTDSDEEVIVVFANRAGVEDDATYTGTSAVVGVKSGEVSVYGILGRGENKLLVVDTDDQPFAKLVYRPEAKPTEIGQSEPTNYVDRETFSQETNGRKLNSETSSESFSSEGQHVAGQTSFSTHKRDDFAVKTYGNNQFHNRSGDHGVHTPSAPSPTPHHIRPQFSTQSLHSNFQAHPESLLPTTYNEPMSNRDKPLLIDPEATARRLGLIRDRSPSKRSESQHSDCSIGSSQLYWNPQEHSEVKPTRRPRFENAEQMISDFASLNFSDDKRHSLRSDIAVWNNEPGHPRDLFSFPNASQEPKLRSTLHAVERQQSPLRETRRSGTRSRNAPPGMAKWRNESRPERPDRSVSSILPMPDMVAACERFEEFAQRAETAQGRFDPVKETADRDARDVHPTRNQSVGASSQSKIKRKPSKGSMSVPFTVDPSVLRDSNRPKTSLHERSYSLGTDPPLLRPASRSRINREVNRGRASEVDIPVSESTVSHGRAQSARPGTQEHRAMSRGRTRSTQPSEFYSADSIRNRQARQDAHKKHVSAKDAVDLAQFTRIEEYTSANCPLHGSRSRSRTGHRTSSRQRTSGTPRTRHQSSSRQGKDIPKTVQNTPQTGNRRAPREPPSAKVPFKLTTDITTSARYTEPSASQGQHNSSGPVSAVPSSASTLSPGQDPKTPVAMVLIADREDMQSLAHISCLPAVKGVGRDSDVTLVKPLSVGY